MNLAMVIESHVVLFLYYFVHSFLLSLWRHVMKVFRFFMGSFIIFIMPIPIWCRCSWCYLRFDQISSMHKFSLPATSNTQIMNSVLLTALTFGKALQVRFSALCCTVPEEMKTLHRLHETCGYLSIIEYMYSFGNGYNERPDRISLVICLAWSISVTSESVRPINVFIFHSLKKSKRIIYTTERPSTCCKKASTKYNFWMNLTPQFCTSFGFMLHASDESYRCNVNVMFLGKEETPCHPCCIGSLRVSLLRYGVQYTKSVENIDTWTRLTTLKTI